ncbi:MAG: sensor histidine kinase [Eubacterium sp.]|jgi:hypothetical protein ELI_3564
MAVKYIALIFGTIFEMYSTNMFISTFSNKKQIKKSNLVIIYLLVLIFQTLASITTQGTILLICSFITAFIICQIYNSKQYIKLILSVTIIIINIASEMIVSGVLMLTKTINFNEINSDPQLFAIGTLISKFIMFLLVLIVHFGKRKLNVENISIKYLVILSVLPFTTLSMLIIMYQVMFVIDNTKLKLMFIISSILLIFSNIITFSVINRQNSLAKAEYELKLLKDNIDEQTKHYTELQSSHEEIRQIRHNIKSMCIGTIAELKVGKTDNAIEQLQSNIDIIEKSSKTIDTGHPSIDSIIENKLIKCDELNITANLSYQYRELITVNEIEIAVIVGNILDNAIEACQKVDCSEKEIWGSIVVDRQNIIINIKNTAISSNNLKTSKIDKKSHGYGLKSISHIAKKYNGYAKFSFNDNIFTSYVILDN